MKPETEALAGFLSSIDFSHFCTFTTRKPVSMAATRRIAENVAQWCGAGDYTTMFWAAEKFDVREGYHFHALLKSPLHPIEIFNWYYPRYGRCQIIHNNDPDRRHSASYYCSKYITKALADYDIYFAQDIKDRFAARIRDRSQLRLM
jgi:hypothetical protein